MSARKISAIPLPPSGLVDINAVATLLGLTVDAVRHLVAKGAIPHYKFGPHRRSPIRFHPQELAAWLQTLHEGPAVEVPAALLSSPPEEASCD